MHITGDQTNQDRENLCGCASNQYGIFVDGSCFVVKDPNCGEKRLCLNNLFIDSSNAFTCTKTLGANQKFNLVDEVCDYSFLGIYIGDNKTILYRELDPCSDNLETINYDFDITLVTADVTADCKISAQLDITLTPDNTTYIATWDNVDTIYIDGEPFVTWSDIPLSWFAIGAQNISNNLSFLTITHTESVNLYSDDNGNWSNVLKVIVGDDTQCSIKYELTINVSYDYNSSILTYDVTDARLIGGYKTDDVVIQTINKSYSVSNNEYTINISGKLKTLNAIKYKSLKSILILSSDTKLGNIEFYNPSSTNITMCIMGVS